METTTTFLENQVNALTILRDNQERMIESLQNQISSLSEKLGPGHQNCDYWKSENGRIQSQLIDLVKAAYEGEEDASFILESICDIIDYRPTKEIEFTATIRFRGRIDVPMAEVDSFDLTAVLEDAYVDINNGDVVIDEQELEDAEEC